jgi:hypothetical protein|tara:strand:+ start:740 stop:1624 length:885 start_codon:yes stop_codon:yes gene_type:complete
MLDFAHIGFHKTGTTWIQKYWFPTQYGILMLKELLKENYALFNDGFCFASSDDFDTKYFRNKITRALNNSTINQGTRRIGWSLEALSGDIFSGKNCYILAERLINTFGKFRIVICIRNQPAMINALYCQYIKAGGTLSPNSFLSCPKSPAKNIFNKLKYNELISYYISLFGKKNVYLYLYEDFLNNKSECLSSLAKFIEISIAPWNDNILWNPSLSKPATAIMRYSNIACRINPVLNNKIRLKISNYIAMCDRFHQNKYYYNDKMKNYIKKYYYEYNKSLLPIFNGKLYKYNYL